VKHRAKKLSIPGLEGLGTLEVGGVPRLGDFEEFGLGKGTE
jgi:hypothetical protein